jgi:5-methylcytosine-specific restriction endonuclease McrA
MGTNHDNAPEHDHVVPMSAGGPNTYANSQLLCRVCNWLKGASHWDDFVARWVKQ